MNPSWLPWSELKISGLPYLREGLLERLHAERGVHADRHPVRQHSPAGPVDDGAQIDPAAGHRDVRDVGGPDLVGAIDLEPAQQVRIDLVGRVLLARVGLAVQRLDAHALHQRGHVPAPDVEALAVEHVAQHAAAGEGMRQVERVDALHQPQVGLGRGARQVVHVASADAHQLGLARDRQCVVAVDHRFALSMPALVSAPDKKSFSKASWPILACSSFRSTGGGAADSAPNTLAARSSNWFFQSLIWLGCTSCSLANSASVFSPSNGVQRHLGLEDRRVVPAGSLAHGPSAFSGLEPEVMSQSFHLSPCSDFRGHLSYRSHQHSPRTARDL